MDSMYCCLLVTCGRGQEQGKADQTVAHSRQVDHVDFTDQIIHLDYTAAVSWGGLKLRIDNACPYTGWLLDVSQKIVLQLKVKFGQG